MRRADPRMSPQLTSPRTTENNLLMTNISAAKLGANRRNAAKSSGPKTLEGKAAAARNATRHAVLSNAPVLPGVESASDWDAHLTAVILSLHPSGYFEAVLASRVASLLWRLGRVTRYETENITSSLETAEEHLSQVSQFDIRHIGRTAATQRARLERTRRERLLLQTDGVDKVVRYETHLDRSLFRALHELQRLQGMRHGTVGPPLALDVDVSVGPSIATSDDVSAPTVTD
jgi:hypothetical protein